VSVTAAGQQGYSYQNDATAWLLLAWQDAGLQRAVVDSGLEDATFWLIVDGAPRCIEVQMKSEKGPIDEDLFAGKWLAHFPANQITGSLLEQLVARPDLVALFVLFAPCAGAVADLCVTEPSTALRPRDKPPIPQKVAQGFLSAFGKDYDVKTPSQMEKQRLAQCRTVAAALTSADFCEVSRRIYILPQLTQPLVRERTAHLLNKSFYVPQSQTAEASDALAAIVKAENKTGRDVVPLVKKEAARFGRELLLRPTDPYVTRAEEAALCDELRQRNALLLTGLPNAGKTRIARSLCSSLQREGFHAEEGSSIDQARRFLTEPGPEERVYLLDDPLGSPSPVSDAARVLKQLHDLLSDTEPHRRLIVTSRIDVLRPVLGAPPTPVDGHLFHEVSLSDPGMAATIWAEHAAATNVDAERQASVDALIRAMRPDELLQPGQIRHLSRNIGRTLPGEDLLRLARYDGAEIGRELCSAPAMREVLAALRCVASTTVAVGTEELYYVLAEDEALPGKDRTQFQSLRLGGARKDDPPTFPAYAVDYHTTRERQEALDELERRGLIERVRQSYWFSHPSYMGAADVAFGRQGVAHSTLLRRLCRRAFFCVRPTNAMVAVAALELLHAAARADDDRREVVALGFDAFTTSIFPVVRDRCVVWLLRHRADMNEQQQRDIFSALRSAEKLVGRVVWQDGEPYLDPRENVSALDPYRADNLIGRHTGVPAVAQLAWAASLLGARLTPEMMWPLLHHQLAESIDIAIFRKALSFDEVFLRSLAARKAMTSLPDRDDLADEIFGDDHPSVFAAGLEGLLSGWGEADTVVRRAQLHRALAVEMTPARATAVLALLEDFEQIGGWYGSEPVPAEPWCLLAARALRGVSAFDRVDMPHLFHYADGVLPRVDPGLASEVLDPWLEWTERAVRVAKLEQDAYDVADLWFLVTGPNGDERPGIVERLLRQEETALFVTSIATMVDQWNNLTNEERELALVTLSGARPDARWARAVALTRPKVPPEVVDRLLGDPRALGRLFRRQCDPVDTRLIGDMLRVRDGDVGSFSTCRALGQLIRRLAREPDHPCFEHAIYRCLVHPRPESWSRRIWLPLCCRADDGLRNRLFHCLLRVTVTTNSKHVRRFWVPLLDLVGLESLLDDWAAALGKYVEAIDGNGNIWIFLQHRRMGPRLKEILKADSIWMQLCDLDVAGEDTWPYVEALYASDARRLRPRLRDVHRHVLRQLGADEREPRKGSTAPVRITEAVQRATKRTGKTMSAQIAEVRDAMWAPVDDWVWLSDQAQPAQHAADTETGSDVE
jgi:hypothetical protein